MLSFTTSIPRTLLIFLFNVLVSLPIHAQSFRPIPDSGRCSGFVEGQGLYISGGDGSDIDYSPQTFVLDLSVSWNTSDPVFRQLKNGPRMDYAACTMTNNGEDLFTISKGTGYVYNVRSNKWTVINNNNFPEHDAVVAGDPKTGLVYLPDGGTDFTGERVVAVVDVNNKTVNTSTVIPQDVDTFVAAAWSTSLKRMIIFSIGPYEPYTFAPSEIGKPSKGWGSLSVPPNQEPNSGVNWERMVPAYGGSKMVLLGYDVNADKGVLYIFDVVKRTWKVAPATDYRGGGACAVTGDQFIVWGGGKYSNDTRVFNLKTKKWVKSYIAPPPRPTTTSPTSQLPQTPTQQPDLGDTSSNDKNLVNIIIIVTGALLAIILTAISVYIGILKEIRIVIQGHINSSSTALFRRTFGRRDPSAISPDPHARHRWYSSSLLSWLYRGPNGVRPPSEHPHAVVELEMRNLQEGAVEVQFPAQHPHATVDQGSASSQNYKAELKSIRNHENR
ncbi:MAG: hypothetical protein J3Q66DRAFT_205539 [Benniella sp.]|nr:MAG: hypothetical protein J3Q66DRAFT_205539 [Benniella sp.]